MKRNNDKQRQQKKPGDIMDWMGRAANLALCFFGLSVPCFLFGKSGWGWALLAVGGIILLVVLALFFFIAAISAMIFKNVGR